MTNKDEDTITVINAPPLTDEEKAAMENAFAAHNREVMDTILADMPKTDNEDWPLFLNPRTGAMKCENGIRVKSRPLHSCLTNDVCLWGRCKDGKLKGLLVFSEGISKGGVDNVAAYSFDVSYIINEWVYTHTLGADERTLNSHGRKEAGLIIDDLKRMITRLESLETINEPTQQSQTAQSDLDSSGSPEGRR